jgi:hypothetical protein
MMICFFFAGYSIYLLTRHRFISHWLGRAISINGFQVLIGD